MEAYVAGRHWCQPQLTSSPLCLCPLGKGISFHFLCQVPQSHSPGLRSSDIKGPFLSILLSVRLGFQHMNGRSQTFRSQQMTVILCFHQRNETQRMFKQCLGKQGSLLVTQSVLGDKVVGAGEESKSKDYLDEGILYRYVACVCICMYVCDIHM